MYNVLKNIAFATLFISIFSHCADEKHNFTVEGKITNGNEQYIYLRQYGEKELLSVDSVKLTADGSYKLSGNTNEPCFFAIQIPDAGGITLIAQPNEKITVNADARKMTEDYLVQGSPWSSDWLQNIQDFNTVMDSINNLGKQLQGVELKVKYDSISNIVRAQADTLFNAYKQRTISYIRNNPTSFTSMLMLYRQFGPQNTPLFNVEDVNDFELFTTLDKSLSETYPNSVHAKQLHEHIEKIKTYIAQIDRSQRLTAEGADAQDIALPSPDGQVIKLSSLRGKYVLLDFWASWCAPCRMENPNLVRAYAKYNKKGFEIYQVSLDKTKDNWVNAIKADNLTWLHVSDLKYWQCEAAKMYNVQGIPASFLIDPDGKIIAKNLRGNDLEKKLAEIFK